MASQENTRHRSQHDNQNKTDNLPNFGIESRPFSSAASLSRENNFTRRTDRIAFQCVREQNAASGNGMGASTERAAGLLMLIARYPVSLKRSIFSATAFVIVMAGALSCFGQTSIDSLRSAISAGTAEEKTHRTAEIRNLHTEAASRVAVPALSDPNDIVRATAAGSVVFLPSAEAADILIKLLKDNSAFVRKEAAYALAKVGDATTMLGEENERTIADALSAVLKTDKDPEVRSAVVIAMGKTGGLYSVERLLSLLKADRNPDDEFLRRSAIRSIGTVAKMTRSGKRSIPSLRNGISAEDFQYLDYSAQFRYFAEAGKLLIAIFRIKAKSMMFVAKPPPH